MKTWLTVDIKCCQGFLFQKISCLKEACGPAGEHQTCQSQQDDIFPNWFIWISFQKKKNTLKSSLTPRFNISRRLHISIKNPTLMISFEDALGTEFLPALEQMMSWEFLHIWLLFFLVRSQLAGYWQASPNHPSSHLHLPQSHLPWPENLTTSS